MTPDLSGSPIQSLYSGIQQELSAISCNLIVAAWFSKYFCISNDCISLYHSEQENI
jgi:hypothetical protein